MVRNGSGAKKPYSIVCFRDEEEKSIIINHCSLIGKSVSEYFRELGLREAQNPIEQLDKQILEEEHKLETLRHRRQDTLESAIGKKIVQMKIVDDMKMKKEEAERNEARERSYDGMDQRAGELLRATKGNPTEVHIGQFASMIHTDTRVYGYEISEERAIAFMHAKLKDLKLDWRTFARTQGWMR